MIAYLDFPDWISPTILPGLPIRWYGMMYLVAFAVTFALFRFEARRSGLSRDGDQIADFLFWTVLGLLLGGRLAFVLFFDPDHQTLRQPWLILWPFNEGRFTGIQGMSYHGGLVGAAAAAIIYAQKQKLRILDWVDTLAVSAPLGYTFGRLGNFVNGELSGRVTTLGWGILFPAARRYSASAPWVPEVAQSVDIPVYDPAQLINLPRHPSQLYEGLLEGIVVWSVLWFIFRKNRPFRGALSSLYVIGYGTARLMAGYFRATDELKGFVIQLVPAGVEPALVSNGLAFTEGQVISLVMIAVGIAALIGLRLAHKPPPTVETFAEGERPSD